MTSRVGKPDTPADIELRALLDADASTGFVMVSGAGSGKTTSIVKALDHLRKTRGPYLRQRAKKIACITYTEVAVGEIWGDVGNDPLFHVSTIHSFLWTALKPFQADIAAWVDRRLDQKIADTEGKIAALNRFGLARKAASRVAWRMHAHAGGLAVVNAVRGHVADARVPVHRVVPGEEGVAVCARVLDAAEACREVGPVLHRLELRLRVRVVVRDVGPAVALGDVQIDQQQGHWLGAHAGAAIGMQRQSAGAMPWRATVSAINCSANSAHSRSAIIQPTTKRLKMSRITYRWKQVHLTGPLSLVMSQDQTLIGRHGQQLGLGVGRVGELIAPFAAAAIGRQQPVHGAHRAQVAALVEQRGVHGRRRRVAKRSLFRVASNTARSAGAKANGGHGRAGRGAGGPNIAARCKRT
jgi:hypothetical protein